MGNFNRDNNRSGGRRDFGGGRPSFGGGGFRGQPRPFMHKATCAECHKDCEVPFKPAQGRPIYCSNCFEKRGNSSSGGDSFRDNFDRKPSFSDNKRPFEKENNGGYKQYKEQFEMLNAKLDKILEAIAPGAVVKPAAAVKPSLDIGKVTETKEPKKAKALAAVKVKAPVKAKKSKAKAKA